MIEKETRKIDNNINADNERKISGYALVFNSLSENLGGFREKINSDSLDGVIDISDVFAYLNHDANRGVLARSKNGKGSLILTIDENGLKYEFEAPKTALGDETIEMIKRGDLNASSFVFTVKKDNWEKQTDGTYIRTIEKFEKLFDVSPVYQPAYSATSVECKRFLEIKENENVIPEVEPEIEIRNTDEQPTIEDEPEPESEPIIENEDVQPEVEPEIIEDETTKEIIEENNLNNKLKNKRKMTEIKLISVINKIAEKRELTDAENEFLNIGKAEFRKSGVAINGHIQIPVTEQRADITATGAGAGIENVSETKLNIVEPLRANSTLVSAGAQMLTGLVGDVSIPTYAGTSVAWKGENVSATDGAGAWGEVVLKPKRLTAYVNVSKQFLLQDSNDAESMLQRDIMNAITEKLEQTILGNGAGSETQPAGLFYGVTGTTAPTYTGLTSIETALEDKNVKNYSFIVNPKAKAALKGVKINEGKMVFADNQIDGLPAYSTSAVYSKGVAVADFRDLVIGVWGIDMTVDPYTLAGDGKVKLIVNAYVDAAFRRPSYSVINLA